MSSLRAEAHEAPALSNPKEHCMKTKNINMNEAQATAKIDLGRKAADAVGKARHAADAIKANPE